MQPTLLAALSILALQSAAEAQAPAVCSGNGAGQAYMVHSQARIGSTLDIELGSPASPGGVGVISVSDGFGPTVFPLPSLGTICLDVFSQGYFTILVVFDGTGKTNVSIPVPNVPSQANNVPLYINGLAVEGTGSQTVLSTTPTSALYWHNLDSYQQVPSLMQEPRAMHTATSTHRFPGDTRTEVLIAGGGGGNFIQPVATATTELYDPLTRSFRPGPDMLSPRAGHRAVQLQDGRILITGGARADNLAQARCEVYDPASGVFQAVRSMHLGRMGHGCTVLSDGRVLVTGGFALWANAPTLFGLVLDSARSTAEVYDPVANTWTQLPAMASQRAGHGQTLLPSGQVIIASGINGSFFGGGLTNPNAVPTYTNTCEVFDPLTNSFVAVAPLVIGRAFFGVSFVGNNILATGGIISGLNRGAAAPTAHCELFDGLTWQTTGTLPTVQAFHTQLTTAGGMAVTHGGYIGDLTTLSSSGAAAEHDGTSATTLRPIGNEPVLNPSGAIPIADHTTTALHDGTWLIVGGTHTLSARDDAWIYQPR